MLLPLYGHDSLHPPLFAWGIIGGLLEMKYMVWYYVIDTSSGIVESLLIVSIVRNHDMSNLRC